MSDTASSRGYAWGLQTDYTTQKTIAASALRRIICTDENTIDYEAKTNNDEGWAHGKNQATQQWIEAHNDSVQHTMPGFAQELGRVFLLNLGAYSVALAPGGTTAYDHTFDPQDPATSRQGKAVTYAERTGISGYNVLSPRCVGNGFSLKGDADGVLMCDFGLQGAGALNPASAVTWPPTATPTVVEPSGLHKLFNTQMALAVTPSGESQVVYGCRYRSFELNYQQTLLLDAGYKPGCAEYLVGGDPTSGQSRSALEFDKQLLNFSWEVDMAAGSPELVHVQQQKPIAVVLTATGGIIEAALRHTLTVTIPVAYYKTSKPSVKNGIYTFTINGDGFFDYASGRMMRAVLRTNVTTYASGW